MIRQVNKLFQGKYIDLREYEVKEALSKKENIVVVYGAGHMTLTPEDLRTKKLIFNKTPFISKVNLGQTYLLYSYLWSPDPTPTQDEIDRKFSQECL